MELHHQGSVPLVNQPKTLEIAPKAPQPYSPQQRRGVDGPCCVVLDPFTPLHIMVCGVMLVLSPNQSSYPRFK